MRRHAIVVLTCLATTGCFAPTPQQLASRGLEPPADKVPNRETAAIVQRAEHQRAAAEARAASRKRAEQQGAAAWQRAVLNAPSDWTPIIQVDDFVMFVHESTVIGPPAARQAWFLFNYFKQPASGVASVLILDEFDCPSRRHRRLTENHYGKLNAVGGPVARMSPNPAWDYHAPNTVGFEMARVACEWRARKT